LALGGMTCSVENQYKTKLYDLLWCSIACHEVERKSSKEPPDYRNTLANLVWLILGGWAVCILHICLAALHVLLIVTIPSAKARLILAWLYLWPFGFDDCVAPAFPMPAQESTRGYLKSFSQQKNQASSFDENIEMQLQLLGWAVIPRTSSRANWLPLR